MSGALGHHLYFDRRLLALRRLRAAAAAVQFPSAQSPWPPSHHDHGAEDPLARTVADHLLDRLRDILRKDFGRAMVLGASHSMARPLIHRLMEGEGDEGRRSATIEEVLVVDLHSPTADAAWPDSHTSLVDSPAKTSRPRLKFIVGDEDFLPVQESCVDLAISVLGLQVCNDLGLATKQIADSLNPEGLLIAAFLSESPMSKLGRACLIAEQEREGGVSPRTHPQVHPGVLGDAASRAGLGISTIDVDKVKIRYPSAPAMVEHFRSLALTNVSANMRQFLPRDTALAASALYQYENAHMDEDRNVDDDCAQDEYVEAEYEIAVLTAWKTKGQRAKRGSGVPFEQLRSELLKKQSGENASNDGDSNTSTSSKAGESPEMPSP